MSNLATLPKNGNLAKPNRVSNFPSFSTWFDDFSLNDFPALFSSNFNTGMSLPKVNIKEVADAFVVEMAVPGLKKSDFNINLENNALSISAELRENNEEKNDDYTRKEFGYSSFKRTFTLPETVNDSKINATYNEGILTVHLPKKEEAKQKPPRAIKIS
ncbi:Hsp20/alpha crystallin family protein [Sabulilitoribacter multivorans]|uniref:Hsp20/alpha crystallin family protein n=1 Tax=Flaviramulus multivorans TaxID=1304750 RepID=A0ABS9IL17_9FLAO|nr:Hsp20/alpha crystallin family protein [Flaviramulus multivorans]MCF7561295.1 Hsp20/alpha crystallin family protein [Flaviramulus multivorans]